MKTSNRLLIIAGLLIAIPFALLIYIGKSPESASGTHANFIFKNESLQSLTVEGNITGTVNDSDDAHNKEGIATIFTPLLSAPTGSGTLTNLVLNNKNGHTLGLIFVRNTPVSVDPLGAVYDFSTHSTSNARNIYVEAIGSSGEIYTAVNGSVSVTEKKGKYATLSFKDVEFKNLSLKHSTDRFEMNGTLVYSEKDIQTGSKGAFPSDSISKYPVEDYLKKPMAPLFRSFLKR